MKLGSKLKICFLLRQDRDDGYGGVATCIKKTISYSKIKSFDSVNIQYVTILIGNLFIINIYSKKVNNYILHFSINNHKYEDFINIINKAADATIPMKRIGYQGKAGNPWWDEECTMWVNKRKEAIKTHYCSNKKRTKMQKEK